MFSWVLKIVPKMDESQLRAMEKSLSSRFTRVAKGFGKGLVSALKGGGIAGAALGLIDKLLNPLKEVQAAIDRNLKNADDYATNARQFETTPGKLRRLVAMGEGTGLDKDNLYLLLTKFQTAVAEAKADPSKPSAVRNYVDQADTAESFFSFIQALKQMDTSQKIMAQQAVFGEKQILKMADFLHSDFAQLIAGIGLNQAKYSSDRLSPKITKTEGLSDLSDMKTARRNLDDEMATAGILDESMVHARDRSERLANERMRRNIARYHNLSKLSDGVDKIVIQFEKLLGVAGELMGKLEPFINKTTTVMDEFSLSKWWKRHWTYPGRDK